LRVPTGLPANVRKCVPMHRDAITVAKSNRIPDVCAADIFTHKLSNPARVQHAAARL